MTATCTTEEHHEPIMNEAIRTVLISLATAGIIWLVYTTVQTKSDMQLVNYKLDQISITLKELKEKK
jgi:hypothetical protein